MQTQYNTNGLHGGLFSLVFQIPQFSLIGSATKWLLPIHPNSIKTSLKTQILCGKCLG